LQEYLRRVFADKTLVSDALNALVESGFHVSEEVSKVEVVLQVLHIRKMVSLQCLERLSFKPYVSSDQELRELAVLNLKLNIKSKAIHPPQPLPPSNAIDSGSSLF
jgi:hypothetical protein